MSKSRGEPRYDTPFKTELPPEELEITRLLFERLQRENCLDNEDRETVAYRIAEIMVTAKQMYTKTLPRLTNVNGESEVPMEDDLAGLQMSFLHLGDLMRDFQVAFLQSLRLLPTREESEMEESEVEESESAENEM